MTYVYRESNSGLTRGMLRRYHCATAATDIWYSEAVYALRCYLPQIFKFPTQIKLHAESLAIH
jgi:hypothetical protein